MSKLYCMCEKSKNKTIHNVLEGKGVILKSSMLRNNGIKQFIELNLYGKSNLKRHYPDVDKFTCKYCGIVIILE